MNELLQLMTLGLVIINSRLYLRPLRVISWWGRAKV